MLRLVTIPISHYCEKARWSLDRAGQRYQEDAHLPVFHLLPTRRAGGRQTVPVLVTPDGPLCQSADIVRWADKQLPQERRLFPEDLEPEIERWIIELDAELGVDTRLWAYAQVLPKRELAQRYALARAPRWQQWMAKRTFAVLERMLAIKLGIDDASVARAADRIDRTLARLDALLADGRPFLLGDRFTALDLTFASLAAAIVSPAEYHVPLPQPEELDRAAGERIHAWRERPSGKHALEMFRRYRR